MGAHAELFDLLDQAEALAYEISKDQSGTAKREFSRQVLDPLEEVMSEYGVWLRMFSDEAAAALADDDDDEDDED